MKSGPLTVEHKTRHVSALVNASAVVGGVVGGVVAFVVQIIRMIIFRFSCAHHNRHVRIHAVVNCMSMYTHRQLHMFRRFEPAEKPPRYFTLIDTSLHTKRLLLRFNTDVTDASDARWKRFAAANTHSDWLCLGIL